MQRIEPFSQQMLGTKKKAPPPKKKRTKPITMMTFIKCHEMEFSILIFKANKNTYDVGKYTQ